VNVFANRSRTDVQLDPWSQAVTRMVRHTEQLGTRIIGIAGIKPGVGASRLARRLAHTYVEFGKTTLLIDASAVPKITPQPALDAQVDIMALARNEQSLWVLDLARNASQWPTTRDAIRQVLDAVGKNTTIVVDLPPVSSANGTARTSYSGTGAACDLVFLVCLSGRTRKSELANGLEICRIDALKVGGVVANEWKVWGSQLLSGHDACPKSATEQHFHDDRASDSRP
jgi:Mrp family chromosome partitioning ATPase